jgi:lysine-specific demethylase/histidyl-hydroxylase NO66
MATATPRTRTPTRTTPDGVALARAIEPVASERFLADYWEAKPLLVQRGETGRYDDLLSTTDVERLVTSPGLRHPGFRLVRADGTPPVSSFTETIPWRPTGFTGAADVPRVMAEWERGSTIVLQGLHHTWPAVAAYARSLEASLGHGVQCNAYYTPRGSQGLAVHHDTHDVFVLQVSGKKRWLVYEPVWELPLKHQRYAKQMGEVGDVVLDVVLEAGDTLYLPRGWMHEALTSDSDSLHLTVGVVVQTWIDAVKAALEECEADPAFRRAPAGASDELVERLASRLDPGAVERRQWEKLVDSRRPILAGQLTQLRSLASLTLDTPLERRPTVIAETLDGVLRFEGKHLRFPAHVADDLAFVVSATGRFTARDLPGTLDESGRLVLARRLVREGFLRAA